MAHVAVYRTSDRIFPAHLGIAESCKSHGDSADAGPAGDGANATEDTEVKEMENGQ